MCMSVMTTIMFYIKTTHLTELHLCTWPLCSLCVTCKIKKENTYANINYLFFILSKSINYCNT